MAILNFSFHANFRNYSLIYRKAFYKLLQFIYNGDGDYIRYYVHFITYDNKHTWKHLIHRTHLTCRNKELEFTYDTFISLIFSVYGANDFLYKFLVYNRSMRTYSIGFGYNPHINEKGHLTISKTGYNPKYTHKIIFTNKRYVFNNAFVCNNEKKVELLRDDEMTNFGKIAPISSIKYDQEYLSQFGKMNIKVVYMAGKN